MSNNNMIDKCYVYILEVKDIVLPVCKIGMTTRTPYQRCNEINNSSTGDFLWSVAHYVAVNNCKALESLVHSKLAPLRQKGREFFNLTAENAYNAIILIIESQSTIKRVEPDEIVALEETGTELKKNKIKLKYEFKRIDSEYTELLQLFASLLGVKGRAFGQLNKPHFGISDGKIGVQWNLSVYPTTGDIKLGVNLEGSEKTGGWLIAPLILSEPNVDKIKLEAQNPQNMFICFSRDAWQGPSRLDIKEKHLGGKEYSLAEMNQEVRSVAVLRMRNGTSRRVNRGLAAV